MYENVKAIDCGRRSARQVLIDALDRELETVIVAGYDREGDLTLLFSEQDRRDSLWLAEALRHWILHGGKDA